MIKAMFDTNQIKAMLSARLERVELAVLAVLRRRGEQFVNDCRDENTYKDQTGNLRSSIGYFIFKGSMLVDQVGETNSLQAANDVPKEPGIYYLIGVAGMNYATAVEAKGYNVISNQSIAVIDLIKGDLVSLSKKL